MDWYHLPERVKGFCLGYHKALQRAGVVLEDVPIIEMTYEYQRNLVDIAVKQIAVDNVTRKRQELV